MLKYIQKISKGNFTDSMTMGVIKKYKINYFSSPNFKVQRKEQTKETRIQRYILCKLIRSFFNANSCIKVENSLTYPLAPVGLSLRCFDGTIKNHVH